MSSFGENDIREKEEQKKSMGAKKYAAHISKYGKRVAERKAQLAKKIK